MSWSLSVLAGEGFERPPAFRQVVANFLSSTPRQKADPATGWIQIVLMGKLFAAHCWERQVGQGVTHELGFHTVLAVELLFKRENYKHLVHILLDELDAMFFPCPKLRAYEENHGNSEMVELLGELEVNVREINEHSDVWPLRADCRFQAAKFAIDTWQMADDLGDTHDSHVFRPDYALETGIDHARATHSDEPGRLAIRFQLRLSSSTSSAP
jgi:hypothetical protein